MYKRQNCSSIVSLKWEERISKHPTKPTCEWRKALRLLWRPGESPCLLRREATNGSERIFNIRKKNQINALPVVHHFFAAHTSDVGTPMLPWEWSSHTTNGSLIYACTPFFYVFAGNDHHFFLRISKTLAKCSPDQPRLNIFSEVARARRQSFFDTSHQKWSEWKTNRSAVIARRLRRKQVFFQFFPFLDHLVWETPPPPVWRHGGEGGSKTKWFKNGKKILPSNKNFHKSSCDHSAPVSFPFWPFWMCGVCYPNPRAPLEVIAAVVLL